MYNYFINELRICTKDQQLLGLSFDNWVQVFHLIQDLLPLGKMSESLLDSLASSSSSRFFFFFGASCSVELPESEDNFPFTFLAAALFF